MQKVDLSLIFDMKPGGGVIAKYVFPVEVNLKYSFHQIFLYLKGNVNIISNDPLFKDGK